MASLHSRLASIEKKITHSAISENYINAISRVTNCMRSYTEYVLQGGEGAKPSPELEQEDMALIWQYKTSKKPMFGQKTKQQIDDRLYLLEHRLYEDLKDDELRMIIDYCSKVGNAQG